MYERGNDIISKDLEILRSIGGEMKRCIVFIAKCWLWINMLACGCIYSGKSTSVFIDKTSMEGARDDGSVRLQVDCEQLNSCVYRPGVILAREIFGLKNEASQMLVEPILRLPTLPLELVYNAWARDKYILQSKQSIRISREQTSLVSTVYNGKETLCKVCDGQTIVVPFRVVHTAKEVDAQPEIPTMKILFVDTGGCLWLSGHVGSDKFWWKYLAGRYNCPNDMLLCKVSLADGKITPIIMRDDNDNVFLAPEQDDFIENRSEGSRKFYFFSGLSRFLMQSHL